MYHFHLTVGCLRVKFMQANKIIPLGILASLLLLQGCTITKGFVARDWSTRLRELNINPVFPPREDFQVGDVYLLPVTGKENEVIKTKGFLPIGTWVNSISVKNALDTHYHARPDFPTTEDKQTRAATKKSNMRSRIYEKQPRRTDGQSVFSPGRVDRLRMVAFPSFFSAEMNALDASALIPTRAIQQLGLSTRNIKTAHVTITSAESYAVPIAKLKKTLFEKDKFCINRVTAMDVDSLKYVIDGQSKQNHALLMIITEVFYARTIKVSLTTEKSISAGNQDNTATTNTSNIVSNPVVPGVSVSFGSSATGDVSIDRTYERPIAIGYRGIRRYISLEKGNGEGTCQTTTINEPVDGDIVVPTFFGGFSQK
jgi:hypothetical protein